jgi:hypothetical protein
LNSVNNAAMKIGEQISVHVPDSTFFGERITRSGIIGSYGNSSFFFLSRLYTVHKGLYTYFPGQKNPTTDYAQFKVI